MPALVTRRARGCASLSVALVRRLAEAMLSELALERAELSVLLTDDETIRTLNREHRHKDRPTDVLAFPLDGAPEDDPAPLLGDVVISIPTAERQATSRRRPLVREVRFLLAHGLLHLIGFDHDTAKKKARMDAMARRLVKSAPLPDDRIRAATTSAPRATSKKRL